MCQIIREARDHRNVLATDLDGTLIPRVEDRESRQALRVLSDELLRGEIKLIFVTGRHLESVESAIRDHRLPEPDWIICDVGTTICECSYGLLGDLCLTPLVAYERHLSTLAAGFSTSTLQELFLDVGGLQLQEEEHQGRYKLSYYADAQQLEAVVQLMQQKLAEESAPYAIVHSVDPFDGRGLIDLLPRNVSKAHALQWWSDHVDCDRDAICYAGDSGNDLAALVAGYRTIVVANADRSIAQQVSRAHQAAGWQDRLCLADKPSTSGVLEGCRWFGIL